MVENNKDGLSRRERQIMDIVFELGEVSASEVHQRLEDPPSYTAVRTTMRILEEKGKLKHRQDGRRYLYQATASPRSAGKQALRRVLQVFYGGSLQDALAAHLVDSQSKVSPDELARIRNLIDEAAKKKRK